MNKNITHFLLGAVTMILLFVVWVGPKKLWNDKSDKLVVASTYESSPTTYEIDKFVLSQFTQKPVSVEINDFPELTRFTIRFNDCQFEIFRTNGIEYVQPEEWNYYCNLRSGEFYHIQSIFPDKCASPETFEVIRNYCIKLK